MSMSKQPLVTVLTPVYSGEDFLAECIESILKQTYENYEYIIVNNCSKDRSLEIALEYAAKDRRIRVHDNEQFVGVIDNHNLAFSLMSPDARYCKVVSADDYIFPDCIARMVELAEANPSVGIVGCYQLSGDLIKWQGFRYPTSVLSGREVCHRFLLERQVFVNGQQIFGFGTPTSLLYRADLVRNSKEFYPNASPHADTSACFEQLQKCEFGFVYEVLSYERTHAETQSSASAEMNRYSSACLNDLLQYGSLYLTKEEVELQLKETLNSYHRFLGVNYVIGFRDKKFWDYHRGRLNELGYPLTRVTLLKAALITALQEIVNPGQAIGKLWKRVFPKQTGHGVGSPQSGSAGERTISGMLNNSGAVESGANVPSSRQ